MPGDQVAVLEEQKNHKEISVPVQLEVSARGRSLVQVDESKSCDHRVLGGLKTAAVREEIGSQSVY